MIHCFKFARRNAANTDGLIAGLHVQPSRDAALSMLGVISAAHDRALEHVGGRKNSIHELICEMPCEMMPEQRAKHWNLNRGLIGYTSLALYVSDTGRPEESSASRLYWSEREQRATLAMNLGGLRAVGQGIVDALFVGNDDYPIQAQYAHDLPGGSSTASHGAPIWIWSMS
jgi:hypothetical protein